MTQMVHPELPGAVINVVDPRGVPIHRKSGWRTADDILVPCNAPDCRTLMGVEPGFDLTNVYCSIHSESEVP